MILLHILIQVKFTFSNSGSAIFYNKVPSTVCWSDDEIVKLRARNAFEPLMPHLSPHEVDAKHIKDILRYFRRALFTIDKESDPAIYKLLQDAIADTIGAHLRSEILPAVRFAYYAGYVPYRNARQIHDLLDDIKVYLNTQGIGWKKPKRTSQKWSNLTVAKILIGAGSFLDPCACLIIKRDSNSCIHLPVPKHDDDRMPTAVALPFKSGGLVSLVSPESSNVLLKYYTTAARCILSKSPEKCRHSDFVNFNNELWHWMKRDVAPHLIDENLYAAYGGILRIAAAVQNYGKGLSRRNLFESAADVSSWNPWKTLVDSSIYINADWTPTVYVAVVLLTAFSIYLVQICYNYICGDSGACTCRSNADTSLEKDVKYQTVNKNNNMNGPSQSHRESMSTTPPQQAKVFYNFRKHKHTPSRVKSLGSVRIDTQKVFDLNENKEKIMDVIVSDHDESLIADLSTISTEDEGSASRKRAISPPRLQPSSQLTVNRSTRSGSQRLLYSTSTMTHTITGSYRGRRESESEWSGSESTTSSRSNSSSSKSNRSRSRSSRDLSWARRVISKQSLRNLTTTSRTELDGTSFTTQTSQR